MSEIEVEMVRHAAFCFYALNFGGNFAVIFYVRFDRLNVVKNLLRRENFKFVVQCTFLFLVLLCL